MISADCNSHSLHAAAETVSVGCSDNAAERDGRKQARPANERVTARLREWSRLTHADAVAAQASEEQHQHAVDGAAAVEDAGLPGAVKEMTGCCWGLQ